MTPEDVLERFRPVNDLRVFAVGVTETGVTVASQQRRAIHLVDALIRCDVLASGSRLAIIGAGAAGLTAAVRAARAGCRVTVFESDAELLATFRGSKRMLHPNLYQWPTEGWLVPEARLPVLSWKAGRASKVAQEIEQQFIHELRSGLIDVRMGVAISPTGPWIRTSGTFVGLTLEPHSRDEQFAAVILAVGFGRERMTGGPFPGYWSDDRLDQASGATPLRYLIQGAGDGGLTDLLRLRLSRFDQDTLFQELLPDSDRRVKNLKAAVNRIEARAADRLKTAADKEAELEIDAEMDEAYRKLDVAWLDDHIASSGLRPHSVVLNDKYVAFGHRRFPLNKLLASRLVTNGRRFDVEWVHRDLGELTPSQRGPIEVDLGDGKPRTFDSVLFRLGAEGAIQTFGDVVVKGCDEMTRRGKDVAAVPPKDVPPPAIGRRSLATAVRHGRSIVDLIQTLLLFLRHACRPTIDLVQDPAFEKLRLLAYEAISESSIVITDTADDIASAAAEFLLSCPESDVAARALVEALELRSRDCLRRSFRGSAGRRHRAEFGPNCVCPRERSPDDATDVGVGTVALMPPGETTLQIEWMATAWPATLRIATGHVFESIEDLQLTELRSDEELVEFFGAVAHNADHHAARLDRLARELARQSFDLVVLPEFALHADPGWASRMSASLGNVVFAGCGHVRAQDYKVHRSLVAFTDLTVLLGKTSPSTYVRGTRRWLEDIHAAPRRLLMVGDGQRLVALATEDMLASSELQKVLASLQPHPLVIAGAGGAGASALCEKLGLAFVFTRIGPPIRPVATHVETTWPQIFEMIELCEWYN